MYLVICFILVSLRYRVVICQAQLGATRLIEQATILEIPCAGMTHSYCVVVVFHCTRQVIIVPKLYHKNAMKWMVITFIDLVALKGAVVVVILSSRKGSRLPSASKARATLLSEPGHCGTSPPHSRPRFVGRRRSPPSGSWRSPCTEAGHASWPWSGDL